MGPFVYPCGVMAGLVACLLPAYNTQSLEWELHSCIRG
jgi:hypothetical protein